MRRQARIITRMAGFVSVWLLAASVSSAGVLPVSLVTQEQDQWCWDASSKCILKYYGTDLAQCTIAEWVRTHATWHNYGSVNCCTDASQGCNYANYLCGGGAGMTEILKHWGLSNSCYSHKFSLSESAGFIKAHRPFIINWQWSSGGGHVVVGHGVDGNNIYYMDPWGGEGFKVASYNWVVSGDDHTWGWSLSVSTPFTGTFYNLVISATTGGTTDPLPGTYACKNNSTVTITEVPEGNYQFSGWSGSVSGTAATVTVTMTGDKTARANFIMIQPPLNFQGQKILNRSLSQKEYINVLTWQANPANMNIVRYKIYLLESGQKTEVTSVDANTFLYWHRKVEKDKEYTYSIVAVNNASAEGVPATVTVH